MTDRAYDIFLNELSSRQQKNSKRVSREEELARKKREALTPIAELLMRIMDLGLIVEHADSAAKRPGMPQGKEERFSVREFDSSPTWAPGVSIFIDHPARLEIAIPNEVDIEEMGPVVISCASEHPDRGMLIQRYNSLHAAADTLARFLAKNTLRMEKNASETQEPPVVAGNTGKVSSSVAFVGAGGAPSTTAPTTPSVPAAAQDLAFASASIPSQGAETETSLPDTSSSVSSDSAPAGTHSPVNSEGASTVQEQSIDSNAEDKKV